MGKRGPGASRQRRAAEQISTEKRRKPSWQYAGLTLAQRVIRFIESLPVTKGRRRGRKMKLLPSQRDFLEAVFDTDENGNRNISLAILSQAKGNGKSGLCAAVILAALFGPLAEERGAVYAASITKNKAGVLFDECKAVIFRVPEFAVACNVTDFHKKITVTDGPGFDTVFESLSADHSGAQGLSPTLWLYDEIGEAPNGKLLKVLMESEGKRDHTLGICLSTQADSDDHPFSELIDDALTGAEPSTYIQLHTAPEDADPFADDTIKAANPAFGSFLDLQALYKARDRAKRMSAFLPSYRRLRLNQRADSNPEDRLISVAVWKDNAGSVDRAALKGRTCFGGLDLSGRRDLTALVLVFPSDDPDPDFDILPFFWTPKDELENRVPAEAERFKQWIAEGFMFATPGPTIRHSFVAAEMSKLAREFDIKLIGYDRHRIDDLKPELDEYGCEVPLEPFGQGFVSMAPAIERFAELALNGKLRHGGHPVLTSAVANAITVSDPAANLKIDKDKSNGRGPVRVDGAVAMVMALQVANRYAPPPPKASLDGFLRNPVMVI